MFKKIIILLFIIISKNVFSNEILNIKTYDKEDYISIVFELKKMPEYRINEEDRIILKFINTVMNINLHKNIDKFDTIEEIFFFEEKDSLKFTILTKNNAKLVRYLYNSPDNGVENHKFIIDIKKNKELKNKNVLEDFLVNNLYEDKNDKSIKNIEDNNEIKEVNKLENKIINQQEENKNDKINEDNKDNEINKENKTENIIKEEVLQEKKEINSLESKNSIDDFLIKESIIENNIFSSVDDLIKENVKARSINELLDLNNINEEAITKAFEEQNNEEVNIDEFLNQLTIDIIKEKPKQSKEESYKYIIVIDAGHGGKDPGALGKFSKEKDINLDFALFIKKEIEKNSKFKVLLTRNKDNFISLADRVNISRKWHADLFISLHSDSSTNKNAKGLSIYTLLKSASDNRTAKLIQDSFMNTINYWKNKKRLDNMRYKALNDSAKFANIMIKNLKNENVKIFGEGHKKANFAVLLAPEYPSILIELGFISNTNDEKLMKKIEYKRKISNSVIKSLNQYFK